MHKLSLFLFLIVFNFSNAQQFNCTVIVNADKIGATNNQIFKTLETSLSEFINRTDFTGIAVAQHEKINCSMFITINEFANNNFSASILVQSARPVFNSTYSSPILNFNDKDFNFSYTEFMPMNFNQTSYESNLLSVVSFYSFVMLGMDSDSFSPGTGTEHLETARNIMLLAQPTGGKGWNQNDGNQSRFVLINDMLSPTYSLFREVMYNYHYSGLDLMAQDLKRAKENVKMSLSTLADLNNIRPNAFLTRVFFDAKSDEIVSIFSGGPSIPISDLVDNLNTISPINSSKWTRIRM